MPKDIVSLKANTKQIPLNIKIPANIHSNPNSKFFIYFPNNTFALTNGKNYENGFWSITQKEMKYTNIILPTNKTIFQFLLINKNSTEDEITSNIYFKNNQFLSGPFISANYIRLNKNEINIKIKSYTPHSTFQIEGIPSNSQLSKGKLYDNIWELKAKEAQDLILTIPEEENINQIHLTIISHTTKSLKTKDAKTSLPTHFSLVINLDSNLLPNKNKYKETIIQAEDIINNSKIKYDKYLLIIKNVPENTCIENAIKLEDKWIVNNANNKQIKIKEFNTDTSQETNTEIKLEFILLNKGLPNSNNSYIKKVKPDFKNSKIQNKDFTKCINCKNMKNCKTFQDFMNYIGYSTILKHIIHK